MKGNQLLQGSSGVPTIGYIFQLYTQDQYKSGGQGAAYLRLYQNVGGTWEQVGSMYCGYGCQYSGTECIYLEEGAEIKCVFGRQYSPNGSTPTRARMFCYTKKHNELVTNTGGYAQYGVYGFYKEHPTGFAGYEYECTFIVNQYSGIQDGHAPCP